MKKTFELLLAGLLMLGVAACDETQPDGGDEKKPLYTREFPYFDEFPIECGNLLTEGSETGVAIEVTKVEDRNFVFELRPGPMVQSFKMDVIPLARLYNNLLNDRNSGLLSSSEAWAVNERIREYLFDESGSDGYSFSVKDFSSPEDFLQIEYDWMNTSYAAASAIAIPDCGYIIAVVGSVEEQISSNTQEDLTLCYVHTTSRPLIGDPRADIEVNVGFTMFGVNHILNSDAAAVYFFGWLQDEIDDYIDTFGDTLFRDFVRTRVTEPSYPDDPNNPESLSYSVNYGDGADPTVMSTTVAVAVDANLTPQEGYSRRDFHLEAVPEGLPEAELSVDVIEERVASSYMEFDVSFTKDCQTVFYNVFPQSYTETIGNMSDKDKRDLGRYLRDYAYGCHNPEFVWDAEAKQPVGSGATVRMSAVGYAPGLKLANMSFVPGDSYVVVYIGRNGAQQLTDVKVSEPFTVDQRNLTSSADCKVKDLELVLDNPTRTSFRGTITYDPSTVSMIYVQYMTADNNPGLDEDSSWNDWMSFLFTDGTSSMLVNAWPTEESGRDGLTWTGMTPDTDYTVFLCAEDFDGNVSEMHFATIRTSEIQVGPDPTVNMALVPSTNKPNDWTVTYTIDHDVEYYLYCLIDNANDLAAVMPGITKGDFTDIGESKFSYEQWSDAIYDHVAGGNIGEDGAGMRTESNTSQDWQGDGTVIAACIAAGRNDSGSPVYKMYHLVCKDGQARTLEEIFGVE